MKVPFLSLAAPYTELSEELDAAYRRVMRSGRFILGEEVSAFEEEFASYCGTRHCVGVSNGLDALTLSLKACGIGAGDEVIVPSNTYIATWLAASEVGATPVPVEPHERTLNIDPGLVEAAITPRTRAILPVHLYGHPADMGSLAQIASQHGLKLIEDCAQAHGARYRGARAGALGDIAAFSFYPTKNLGAFGDGGAVTTNDAVLAERVRLLRNYGSPARYSNEIRGRNCRLDELQAAFLRARLPRLDEWNARRTALARRYLDGLKGTGLALPASIAHAEPVWHLFVVRSKQRAKLQECLTARGIESLIHYPVPPHLQPAYADLGLARGALPISEAIHEEVLSLPLGPHLDAAQADYVIEQVVAACLQLGT